MWKGAIFDLPRPRKPAHTTVIPSVIVKAPSRKEWARKKVQRELARLREAAKWAEADRRAPSSYSRTLAALASYKATYRRLS